MNYKILFVIGELGSARYCLPLWNQLINKKESFDWKILAFGRINDKELLKFSKYLIYNYDYSKSFEENIVGLDWCPNLIFSSATYQKLEYESLKFAKTKNVLGIQFFDTWYNYYEKLAKENRETLATKICMIDKFSSHEAIAEGVDEKKLITIGQPGLEFVKEKKIKSKNKNILFINQPIAKHKYDVLKHLGYDEEDVWEIVFKAMSKIRNDFDEFLFAKHPDEHLINIDKKIINNLKITIIENGQIGIDHCDTIIGMWSTLMIDAFFQSKDVISIIPKFAKKNNCTLSKRNFIPLVMTSSKLIDVLRSDFRYEHKKIKDSLKGSTKRLHEFLMLEIEKLSN